MDLSRIRADASNRIDPADLTAKQRAGIKSRDDRSFVAEVSVAQLVDAGLNTGRLPMTDHVLLFVNHGDWKLDEFPVSRAGSGTAAGSTAGEPEPRIAWNVAVRTVGISGSSVLYAPDNECFRG